MADDGYVIEAFKQLPIKKELFNQLHQHVVVAKLFDESEEAYRLRCFAELHMKLRSDTRQGFNNEFRGNTVQVAQQILEGIVGGGEESSLTLEFFKVKTLDLQGANEVGTGRKICLQDMSFWGIFPVNAGVGKGQILTRDE
ncbi:hypothetical protein SADUNF_Sadunf04G0133500 [Salix dunnii]|uniref:Uncharacterized protein n=1 Tax=Salix dunnii TaxID=1413687 RepID=A0A835KER9_9ROSI|nr:hypothetical protein SADUNF_Sadunf04G0133500 [Salix dunnii]